MRAVTLLVFTLCACATTSPDAGGPTAAEAWSADALYRHGRQLASRGDLLKAEQYLALAVRAGYPAGEALPALVRVCMRASRVRAALRHARGALLRDPDSDLTRFIVATLLVAMAQHDRARAHLQQLARGPNPHPRATAMLASLPTAPTTISPPNERADTRVPAQGERP